MSLKRVFLSRVKDKLYTRLRGEELKGWDTGDVLNFANAVIADNEKTIDDFLDSRTVTLRNLNDSIEELIEKVLLPSIEVK